MKPFDTNLYTVFSLNYVLLLPTKGFAPLITDEISDFLKDTFVRLAKDYKITISVWGFESNCIRVYFKSSSLNSTFSKFINAYKVTSSRLVKKQFNLDLANFWEKSFALFTQGEFKDETYTQYREWLKTQKEFRENV